MSTSPSPSSASAENVPSSLPTEESDRRRQERQRLYRQAMLAAALGWLVNLLLGISKLVGGWLGDSLALLSDSVNSLGDLLVSTVVLVGLHVAQRPVSTLHPYGFMRAEAIAASNVAMLVMLTAVLIGREACQRWGMRHEVPPMWALAIAVANVVIKEGLYQYKVRVGNRTGSIALLANAWDHRGDAMCSLAVVVGLALVKWGGPAWLWADEAAALLVAIAIFATGAALYHKAARELLDVQPDADFVRHLRHVAASVPGVAGVEKLWVRKAGLEYFVDIHIEVSPELSVAKGHDIGHHVKNRLLEEFITIRDVLVHLEPKPLPGHDSRPPPYQ